MDHKGMCSNSQFPGLLSFVPFAVKFFLRVLCGLLLFLKYKSTRIPVLNSNRVGQDGPTHAITSLAADRRPLTGRC